MVANSSFALSVPGRLLRFGGLIASATAALLPMRSSAAEDAALVADLYVQGPTVLAFVPASMSLADGTDPSLAQALAAKALSQTAACLGDPQIAFQLVVADRVVVHDGPRVASFDIANSASLAGALLVAPGKNPSVLFAGGGPASLAAMLPSASGHYFRRTCVE